MLMRKVCYIIIYNKYVYVLCWSFLWCDCGQILWCSCGQTVVTIFYKINNLILRLLCACGHYYLIILFLQLWCDCGQIFFLKKLCFGRF